jgi:hypothetical protein
MHYKKMLVGDYIAAVELDSRTPTLTIRAIKSEMMESIGKPGDSEPAAVGKQAPKKKKKWIVFFKEMDRGWVLNRTNILCLAAMFGEDSDGWVGKRVTIYAEMVRVGPKTEPGIRVKGSPDITAPVVAVIELPRKRPTRQTLVNTPAYPPAGKARQDRTAGAPTSAAAGPPPPSDMPDFGDEPEPPPPDDDLGAPEPGSAG